MFFNNFENKFINSNILIDPFCGRSQTRILLLKLPKLFTYQSTVLKCFDKLIVIMVRKHIAIIFLFLILFQIYVNSFKMNAQCQRKFTYFVGRTEVVWMV